MNYQVHINSYFKGGHHVLHRATLMLIDPRDRLQQSSFVVVDGEFQEPVLISETEPVGLGDFVLGTDLKIYQVDQHFLDDDLVDYYGKIIAFPEQFSDQQRLEITKGKIYNGEDVNVQCIKNMDGVFVYLGNSESNRHIKLYPLKE